MKLIAKSIICGFVCLIISSEIFKRIAGNYDNAILLIGILGFVSPSMYILNSLYEKSKINQQQIKKE